MAYPKVVTLPNAPSKIGDQVNFVNQSALFLQALPAFRTQFNALLTYINNQSINKYHCGTLDETNPISPALIPIITPVGSGVPYVSGIDLVYSTLKNTEDQSDIIGEYIDDLVSRYGVVSSDSSQPNISPLTVPQDKTQSRVLFNTTAISFTASAKAVIEGLGTRFNYINLTCFATIDNGLITDATISETIDAGSLTDNTITN